MSVGWCSDLTDAETYFTSERLITDHWDTLSDDDMKKSVLTMAYNRLYYSSEFTLPTFAAATTDQLVILRKANCEMAYYLTEHLSDEDTRKNLQVQGIVEAGIVKEKYDKDMLMTVPIPPFVLDMLYKAGFMTKTAFKIVGLERDENKAIKK